ncbi:MAG: hypothetical protein ACOH5I_14170 [Oligoflexus sp.]
MKSASGLLIVLMLMACHQDANHREPFRANTVSDENDIAMHFPYDSHWQAIAEIIRKSPVCPKEGLAIGYCEKLQVAAGELYQEGRLRQDQRVLIIDDFSSSATIHFNHRIRSTYQVNENGSYQRAPIRGPVFRGAWDIAAIIADSGRSAESFADLSERYRLRFGKILNEHSIAHGNAVLDILAIYNPEAEFVLASGEYHQAFIESMCRLDFPALEQFLRNRLRSLLGIIATEEIQFINYSAGYTKGQLRRAFADLCGVREPAEEDLDEFLRIEHAFIEQMSNLSQVIFVQAAASVPAGIDPLDFAPNDCLREGHPNRLRVAYLLGNGLNIPREGTDLEAMQDYIPPSFLHARPCIDVYLNARMDHRFPFKPDVQPIQVSDGALGLLPLPAPASSFISPLALSRMINIKEVQFSDENLSDQLIQRIFKILTHDGARMVQDPMFHHDLEKFRLNSKYDG